MSKITDEPLFLHDDDEEIKVDKPGVWKILIVDDDQEIHAVTKMALADVVISGPPVFACL